MRAGKADAVIQDLHPGWLNVARRLQAASAQQQGAAIITVRIIVDGTNPICWLEPEIIKLEPKARASEIIKYLTE